MFGIWMPILTLTAVIGQAEQVPWVSAEYLSYEISLDAESYVPAEVIIVTSTVTNKGDRRVQALEPSPSSGVVTYRLFRITADGREYHAGRVEGFGPPMWKARKSELAPGETTTSTYDGTQLLANVFSSGPLRPGRYVLLARYHLAAAVLRDDGPQPDEEGDGSSEPWDVYRRTFETDIVRSNEVEFTIRELNEVEQEQWDGLSHLQPEEFLKKYPESIYRVHVLRRLTITSSQAEDWETHVKYLRQLRKEKTGLEQRDGVIRQEAYTLAEKLDDVPAAIEVLKESTAPNNVSRRRILQMDLERRHGPLPQVQ